MRHIWVIEYKYNGNWYPLNPVYKSRKEAREHKPNFRKSQYVSRIRKYVPEEK